MALQSILVGWTKEVDRGSETPFGPLPADSGVTPTVAGRVQVTANAILQIDEGIVDRFNIPLPTDPIGAEAVIRIKEYTYTRYPEGVAGTDPDVIVVPEHERMAGGRAGRGITVRLATGLGVGRAKSGSFRVPGFFTIPMISQLVGSMVKANAPSVFKLDATGKSYALVPNESTAALAGRTNGAWVLGVPLAPVNADEAAGVGETTVIKGRAKAKTATAPTT